MAYAPLVRLSLPRIVRWRVVPVCQSSPVTSHPVASFHPLTNTISDDVLTAGIMLGELTSARVHLASHLFSFVFQLTHSAPLGVSTVGPMASTPIILSFIFSVVWLMLFTTKASYPAVTTDLCYDLYHAFPEPPYPEDLKVAEWVLKQGEPKGWIFFGQECLSDLSNGL